LGSAEDPRFSSIELIGGQHPGVSKLGQLPQLVCDVCTAAARPSSARSIRPWKVSSASSVSSQSVCGAPSSMTAFRTGPAPVTIGDLAGDRPEDLRGDRPGVVGRAGVDQGPAVDVALEGGGEAREVGRFVLHDHDEADRRCHSHSMREVDSGQLENGTATVQVLARPGADARSEPAPLSYTGGMTTTDVVVPTPDGSCAATLHQPEGSGPWPAVIMYPDAGGVRETFRQMGDRLAEAGYVVLVPDVYYRSGGFEPFSMATAFSDPDERSRLMHLVGSLTADMSKRDSTVLADFLGERPEVAPGPIGTTGYCMGGRISLTVAGHLGARVGAAASFHGGRLAVEGDPDSPHLLASDVAAKVFVAGAENDDSFDAEQEDRLRSAYRAAGVQATIETYPAAHGVAVTDNPTFDPGAAERHWSARADLFGSALG
jgi:carboxymethylenebutenolidase